MELTVYIETVYDYEIGDIQIAIEKALERGSSDLTEAGNDYHAGIIDDITNNSIVIEEDGTH